MQRDVLAPLSGGEYRSPSLQSLHHFCTENTQTFVQPGYFDLQANWYRLIVLDGVFVTMTISPEGCVQWTCREKIESAKVQEAIQRLCISISLPEEVKARLPQTLLARFWALHPLVHIASLTFGEALMKAIIRQVITASHAKKLTDSFIRRYGDKQFHNGNIYYSFPSLETISTIPLSQLQEEGLGFKAKVVQCAALHFLENDVEAKLARMAPEEALASLTAIKGIGRWTAHVALCDTRADWSYYPFEDLAVRTWARKLWTGITWPHDPQAFASLWQQLLGEERGVVTFYLLSCATTSPGDGYTQEALF